MTLRLSPSQLNEFDHCPFYWQCVHILRHTGIPIYNPQLDYGKNVHSSILEYFTTIPRPITDKVIDKHARSVLKRVTVPRGKEQRHKKITSNFVLFEQKRLRTWKQYMPTMVEKVLDVPDMQCIIDFYGEPDTTIIDWKTSKVGKIGDYEKIQGSVMKRILELVGKNVQRVQFVFLTTGQVLDLPSITWGWTQAKIDAVNAAVKSGMYPARGRFCNNCEQILRCQYRKECIWSI